MQVKFLKSIVESLINKQSTPIIDLLIGKKHVNEFLIAKKLKLTINQTRNILYKLSDYGLVSFMRKKDKRKGWYIYFWTLNIYQSLSLLEKNLKKELEQLETQLKNRKEKRYYSCNTCSIEVNEETALMNDFVCSECEEVYQLSQNKESIEQLEKEINKIKKEMEMVINERKLEEEKLEKKKTVKIKAAEKKVKAERSKNRELKKKAKKIEDKSIKTKKASKKSKSSKKVKKPIKTKKAKKPIKNKKVSKLTKTKKVSKKLKKKKI